VTAADDSQLTFSLVQADPGPDSFLLGDTGGGQDALIDRANPAAV
jgi:hypothetical protein